MIVLMYVKIHICIYCVVDVVTYKLVTGVILFTIQCFNVFIYVIVYDPF